MTTPGYDSCASIFMDALRHHLDLMEPYAIRLGGADDAAQRLAIMRQGLAETFRRRYPMPPEYWAAPVTQDDVEAWTNHLAKIEDQRRVARERFAKREIAST